jgi:hypothetical protein
MGKVDMTKLDKAAVPIYVNLIKARRKTIDDVPLRIRDAVQEALDKEKMVFD